MIKWLKRAQHDLEKAYAYIARHNPSAAADTVLTILDAVEQLEEFPDSGRIGRVKGTRELVVAGTSFIVPYRQKDNAVEILRVYHAARMWPKDLS